MPYTITTGKRWDDRDSNTGGVIIDPDSRHTVATLDDVREEVIGTVAAARGSLAQALGAITDEGAKIGPLPDGTVITVEPCRS